MDSSSSFNRWLACMGKMSAFATAAVVLAGCPAQTKELVVTVPKEVQVAVATKCIKKGDVPLPPAFPLDVVNLDNPNEELARTVNAARAEVKVRREYVSKTQEVLSKCSD